MFKISQKVLTGGLTILLASVMAQPLFAKAFEGTRNFRLASFHESAHESADHQPEHQNADNLAVASTTVSDPSAIEVSVSDPTTTPEVSVSNSTNTLVPGVKPSISGMSGDDDSEDDMDEDSHDRNVQQNHEEHHEDDSSNSVEFDD